MADANTTAHPFAHLGPAPYRLIGVETHESREATMAARAAAGEVFTTNLCGGSCDHCGTAITNVYRFRAADGTTFKVGADCAVKASDPNAIDFEDMGAYDAQRRLNAEIKAAKRASKGAKDAAKIAAAESFISENADALAALPHPNARRAAAGETLLDSLRWMFANAGNAGKLKAAKAAYAALGLKMPRAK